MNPLITNPMNQITREQAFDLAKYRYKLVDKEGKIWNITDINDTRMKLYCKSHYIDHKIPFSRIGDGMFILCRDLSQLTETIEHEGESFVPLERLLREDNFNLDVMSKTDILEFKEVYGDKDFISYKTSGLLQYWHFNLGFPQETVNLITNEK